MRLAALLTACSVAVLLGSACSTTPAGDGSQRRVTDGARFTLSADERVRLPDGSLRALGVRTDSRCPPEVQCVWAGDAEVAFEWIPAAGSAVLFSLHSGRDPRSRRLGRHQLTLVALARGPQPPAELLLEALP